MGRPKELTNEERNRLIAEGFRPIEVWVRDVNDDAYRAEAHRQTRNAAAADAEDSVMDWVEAVSAQAWEEP